MLLFVSQQFVHFKTGTFFFKHRRIGHLRSFIYHTLIHKSNYNARNITKDDYGILIYFTQRLFEHLYQGYKEVADMRLYDNSLNLDIDRWIDERDAALEKNEELTKELDAAHEEIARLKEKLSELESN